MMLFYKAWRESQTRFLAAVVGLAGWCLCLVVLFRGQITDQPYDAYVNTLIFDGLGKTLFVLLVIFLGLGGLLRERARHTAVFTLALPVGREQLIGAQIAVGLAELALLALLPMLLIPPLSALVHQSYPIADALRFSLLRFVCGTLIFATSFLLSVVLRGEYTAVVGCFVALIVDGQGSNWDWLRPYHTNILRTLGARWDRSARGPDLSGPLPWTLLLTMMLIGLVLFAVSTRITQRQNL